MNHFLPARASSDIVNICAEHTRRVQLLAGQFWKGDIDTWHYRKQSRELTQQFVMELQTLFNQTES